ncbi:MAG: histidine phosphatase family protein, partial [Phototrophicales bacterium]
HAQASLGASNYDQLSDHGLTQASHLASYLIQNQAKPAHILTGTLRRHIQTATPYIEALQQDQRVTHDARWNEFDFDQIVRLHIRQNNIDTKGYDQRAFFRLLKQAMLAWQEGVL